MIEVLWHGRGGQGAFTAARLLGAAACYAQDTHALAFPSFGPERRGAPMRAFTKISDSKIGDRSALSTADYVVYLDDTLFVDGWETELKPGGKVLLNTSAPVDDERVVCIDANAISRRILKREIPNTCFLAALCELIDALSAANAKQAIEEYMPAKLHTANQRIVDEVAALMGGAANGVVLGAANEAVGEAAGAVAAGNEASRVVATDNGVAQAPARVIPRLKTNVRLDPAVYARTTCWEAGHLVSKNAGWRIKRPIIDSQACTGCLLCYMQCPDGTIFKSGPRGVAVDYDFCKGCGICAKACRSGAIRMAMEGGER